MEITGNLRKMRVEHTLPVTYFLRLGEEEVTLNDLIGKEIAMDFLHKIHCIRCGRETSRSFAQGYCYPCFISAPETEECVLKPELCRAHLGEARDMEYAREHCLIEHVVYLSLTSGIKVGVTRNTQVPVRWIDQGAVKVMELARTPNRYTAGLVEVEMKKHIQDKTNWRRMLRNEYDREPDLPGKKAELGGKLSTEMQDYLSRDDQITEFEYPVQHYPEKIRSLNFDKTDMVRGKLEGIKGQYLIFTSGEVINIRKFGGYLIRFSTP